MARLGDICTVVSGSTPKTNIPEYWDGDVKWITPAELNEDSCYLFDSQRHISELGKEKTGLSYMPAGTVILSSRAPIGKTAIAGCELCCNQGFKNLICSDVIFNEYLYFFLKSKTDYLNSLGRGATFKEISKSIVENIEIRLPSLEEQKKAAKQLGHIYHLISLRKQQLAKLDELVKARFVELFGDPEYNNKGWKTESLGELCEVGSSKRIYQNEQSTEGVPFLRISDLVNKMDTGINDCDLYIPESRFSELLELGLVPKSGDILVTARGTLGRCYIIKPEDKFYFQDGMITWLSQFSNSVTALYISHLFTMPGFRKQIDGLQAGSTVAYLSISMTKKLVVMLPPIELQNQFADFVEQTDKSKLAVQQSLVKLELLKKALMQKYFG